MGAAQIIAEQQMIGLLVHVGFGSSLVVLFARGTRRYLQKRERI